MIALCVTFFMFGFVCGMGIMYFILDARPKSVKKQAENAVKKLLDEQNINTK